MRALDDLSVPRRYLELKAQIAELNEELDSLKPILFDALTDEPDARFVLDGFEFRTGIRRTYTYSEAVRQKQDELRSLKKQEERDGTAQLSRTTGFVIVRQTQEAPSF